MTFRCGKGKEGGGVGGCTGADGGVGGRTGVGVGLEWDPGTSGRPILVGTGTSQGTVLRAWRNLNYVPPA